MGQNPFSPEKAGRYQFRRPRLSRKDYIPFTLGQDQQNMVYIGLRSRTDFAEPCSLRFSSLAKKGAFRRRTREALPPSLPCSLGTIPSSLFSLLLAGTGGGEEGQGLPGEKMAEICFANCGAQSFSTIKAKAGHSS